MKFAHAINIYIGDTKMSLKNFCQQTNKRIFKPEIFKKSNVSEYFRITNIFFNPYFLANLFVINIF